jgi:hypothetical protein
MGINPWKHNDDDNDDDDDDDNDDDVTDEAGSNTLQYISTLILL